MPLLMTPMMSAAHERLAVDDSEPSRLVPREDVFGRAQIGRQAQFLIRQTRPQPTAEARRPVPGHPGYSGGHSF